MVMPAVASHTVLAVNALIRELDAVPRRSLNRMSQLTSALGPRATHARAAAIDRLAAADRLAMLESAAQALAVACARRQIPRPARAAAYAALVGLIASDLVTPATFRTLYAAWETTIGRLGDSPALLGGEEVLLHIR
jgi:hypothetical protein